MRFEDDNLVGITGAVPARIEEWRQIEKGLPWVTFATVALIALVLGIHFRSPVAPLVTLLAAGVAYLVAMRTVAFVGDWLDVSIPREAEPILIVLLLGVVTDYAVFFLHGLRERLDAGETRLEAAESATAEYLPIVVTAGLIVAGGTASLMAGELGFFRAFGPGMAMTVLISLAVAITLVPALMAILGQRLFWPSRRAAEQAAPGPSRLAYFTTARPVAFVIAAVALVGLVFACRGLLETNLGLTQIQGLPSDSEPRRAQDAAAQGFAPGILSPTVVLLEGVDEQLDLPGLVRLQRSLDDEPGVAASIGPATPAAREIPGLVLAGEADAARFLLVLDHDPRRRPRDRLGGSAARPFAGARRGGGPRGRTGTAGRRHRARCGDRRDDQARPRPDRDRRVPRQLPPARALPAGARGAAVPRALVRPGARGEPRPDDARLPGLPRPRRADLLRAVRGRGAPAVARVGLQRLRRRPDLAGGGGAAAP